MNKKITGDYNLDDPDFNVGMRYKKMKASEKIIVNERPGYPLNDPDQGNKPLDIDKQFIGSDCITWPVDPNYKPPKRRWRLRLRSPLQRYWGRKGDWRYEY